MIDDPSRLRLIRKTWLGCFHILISVSKREPHGGSGKTHDQIAVTELRFSKVYFCNRLKKKKAKAEGKTCHAKTMLSLEKPIKLI